MKPALFTEEDFAEVDREIEEAARAAYSARADFNDDSNDLMFELERELEAGLCDPQQEEVGFAGSEDTDLSLVPFAQDAWERDLEAFTLGVEDVEALQVSCGREEAVAGASSPDGTPGRRDTDFTQAALVSAGLIPAAATIAGAMIGDFQNDLVWMWAPGAVLAVMLAVKWFIDVPRAYVAFALGLHMFSILKFAVNMSSAMSPGAYAAHLASGAILAATAIALTARGRKTMPKNPRRKAEPVLEDLLASA